MKAYLSEDGDDAIIDYGVAAQGVFCRPFLKDERGRHYRRNGTVASTVVGGFKGKFSIPKVKISSVYHYPDGDPEDEIAYYGTGEREIHLNLVLVID